MNRQLIFYWARPEVDSFIANNTGDRTDAYTENEVQLQSTLGPNAVDEFVQGTIGPLRQHTNDVMLF